MVGEKSNRPGDACVLAHEIWRGIDPNYLLSSERISERTCAERLRDAGKTLGGHVWREISNWTTAGEGAVR